MLSPSSPASPNRSSAGSRLRTLVGVTAALAAGLGVVLDRGVAIDRGYGAWLYVVAFAGGVLWFLLHVLEGYRRG
jgi:hypothetical protein